MKKKKAFVYIIIFFVLLFWCVGLTSVFAQQSAIVISLPENGYYFERIGTNHYHSARFHKYSFNGETAYCIEPGVDITSENYLVHEGLANAPYNMETMKKLELIGYYGYGYPEHNTIRYRIATQELIWTSVSNYTFVWNDQKNGAGNPIDLSYEKNEIMRLVNAHYIKPSFNDTTVYSVKGEYVTLTDTNNVLTEYEIYGTNTANATINGNKLTFKLDNDTAQLRLVRKQWTKKSSFVYTNDGQTMATFGLTDPVISTLNIAELKGSVQISKVDSDTLLSVGQGDGILKGATFDVYTNSGKYMMSLTTDEKGYAKGTDILPIGDYYLKEKQSSLGYTINPTEYRFTITKDNLHPTVTVTEKVIERDIEFYKVLASNETGFLTGEPNVTFEFHLVSSGNLYTTATTDSNGHMIVKLPYGKYLVKQVNSAPNYEKMEDFEITVNENQPDPMHYMISNAISKGRVKIVKIDSVTGKPVLQKGIKFKIKDLNNNNYVCQKVYYPNLTEICEYETDENGTFTTPYQLEWGRYAIEEVNQSIDGYLWNPNPIEFEIDGYTKLISDPEYGLIFEIQFANAPVKGKVEIHKIGERLVVEKDSYHYEDIELDGVAYNLYAEEDIYSKDGTLIYSTDDLVGTYTTEDGHIVIENLYLGKYYLIEAETDDSHILDNEKHHFSLDYKDQFTPIVSLSFSYKNYLKKGILEFIKTDVSTGNPLPNTKIQIFDSLTDNLIFEGITDENGKILLENLYVGKFYVVEVEAPNGYILNSEKIEFEVKENDEIVKVEMTNQKIKSTIKIHKIDDNSISLSGVEIGIFDLEGNLLNSYITDENGEIELDLEYGSYYYQELKTTSDHILNEEKIHFEVTNDGEIISFTIVNETIKVPNTSLSDWGILDFIVLAFIGLGVGYLFYDSKKK